MSLWNAVLAEDPEPNGQPPPVDGWTDRALTWLEAGYRAAPFARDGGTRHLSPDPLTPRSVRLAFSQVNQESAATWTVCRRA
jgi:hypothetical protein